MRVLPNASSRWNAWVKVDTTSVAPDPDPDPEPAADRKTQGGKADEPEPTSKKK